MQTFIYLESFSNNSGRVFSFHEGDNVLMIFAPETNEIILKMHPDPSKAFLVERVFLEDTIKLDIFYTDMTSAVVTNKSIFLKNCPTELRDLLLFFEQTHAAPMRETKTRLRFF